MPEIQILGGGMAGLTAAYLLEKQKQPYQLHEASNHWGGKLQTTLVDGFALDHGFQVIQSAYPALSEFKKAGMFHDARAFGSGAWLLTASGKTLLADPTKHFPKGLGAIFHPDIKISDALAVVKLRSNLLANHPENFFQGGTLTTHQFLLQSGFSESFIESFFRPFFTGILLEEALASPPSMFQFVFWALAKGPAWLMPGGVQTLPNRIVSTLNPSRIHLNSEPMSNHQAGISFKSTTVVYFSNDTDAGLGKFIALNASRMGRVNLLAVLSAVQEGYAPKGKHLLAVSLKPSFSGKVDVHEAKNEILTEVENLLQQPLNAQFIQSIEVKKALPNNTPYNYDYIDSLVGMEVDREVNFDDSTFFAGASIANPSLNAAILSGMSFVKRVKSL